MIRDRDHENKKGGGSGGSGGMKEGWEDASMTDISEHSPLVARSYACSELLLTSCSNGSFLECSPPTVEAQVFFIYIS